MTENRRDYFAWHGEYDDPTSRLSARLRVVKQHLRDAIDRYDGPLRIISMCAGQGRDVIDVLATHPRNDEIDAALVELDSRNVAIAREAIAHAKLGLRVQILHDDASRTGVYAPYAPADIVLACGMFGNITFDDIARTIAFLPQLSAPGATVIWTRGEDPDEDVTTPIRQCLATHGFEELTFDTSANTTYRVGSHRLIASPQQLVPGQTIFTFFN